MRCVKFEVEISKGVKLWLWASKVFVLCFTPQIRMAHVIKGTEWVSATRQGGGGTQNRLSKTVFMLY